MRKAGGFLSFILQTFGIFLIYFLAGQLGLTFAFFNPSASPIWPPTAIALAAFLFLGYRIWPAIFLGAFLFNLNVSGDVGSSLLIALGNTLEGIVGCWLVNRFANGIHAFERPLSILQFTLWAGFISTLISATVGVTALVLFNLALPNDFIPIWFPWWLGDATGNIVFAPFCILWFQKGLEIKGKIGESVLLLLFLFFGSIFVFNGVIENIYPLTYLSIPAVVWAAYRFGPKASSAAVLILSIVAIYGTVVGYGPFALDNPNLSLLLLQMFLGTISVTNLILAALEVTSKQAEKRFRSMIEHSTDAIALINAHGTVLYASPSTYKILKLKAEEFVGRNNFERIYPDDRPAALRRLADLLQNPEKISYAENRMVKKDGSIIWIESTSTNMLADSAVRTIVVNYRDMTKHKKRTQEMQEEKARDAALLESIGEGIIAMDEVGRIIRINLQGKTLLGYTQEKIIGKFLVDILSLQDERGAAIPIEKNPVEMALKNGKKISTHNYYCVRKDGTKFPAYLSASPIYFKKKIIGVIEVFENITHEKEVDKTKTEFISLASHQLRTPLTIISWISEILTSDENKKLAKDQIKHLQEIQEATKRMVDLVNGLLNVSRLELGTFPVEPGEVDMQIVLDTVLQDLTPQIKKKHLSIKKEIDGEQFRLYSDPNLVQIVLQNILSNAIKFSHENKAITVILSKSKSKITVSVSDQGIGIPKHHQEKIFTKLFRSDNAKEMDPDGTGLGLYITKSVMEVIDSSIAFTSKENVGTTFTLHFPEKITKKGGKKKLIQIN